MSSPSDLPRKHQENRRMGQLKKEIGEAVAEAISRTLADYAEGSQGGVTVNNMEVNVQVNHAEGSGGPRVNVKN